MQKIMLLLSSLLILILMTNEAPAIGGDETLICYFHGAVYDILEGNDAQCGLPSEQLVNNTPAHHNHIYKRLDVHDPECFTWVYMRAH